MALEGVHLRNIWEEDIQDHTIVCYQQMNILELLYFLEEYSHSLLSHFHQLLQPIQLGLHQRGVARHKQVLPPLIILLL